MKFSCKIFSRGEIQLKVLQVEAFANVEFSLESLVIDKKFDPSPRLLNDSCRHNIKIVKNELQHIRRNSFNFAFDVLLQSLNCLRIILVNLVFEKPQRKLSGGLRSGNKEVIDCLSFSITCPLEAMSQVLKSARLEQ